MSLTTVSFTPLSKHQLCTELISDCSKFTDLNRGTWNYEQHHIHCSCGSKVDSWQKTSDHNYEDK
jgi:hypothetical protein